MIEVRELVKVFDTRGQIVRAVDNVSTTVAKGEVLVVIGPSGSGKSTFLRCLNGLEEFDSGSVSIDGLAEAMERKEQAGANGGEMFSRKETLDLIQAYYQLGERPRRRLLDLAKSLHTEGDVVAS